MSLDDRPSITSEACEELAQLAGDHRAGVGARQVRPVCGTDVLRELERFAVGLQPSRTGRGVLRQEADQISRRALGAEVARAPVPELLCWDLQ